VYGGIWVEEQVVVRRDCITCKGATAQRSQEHLIALRKQLPSAAVVIEVQLASAKGEDAAQHQLGHSIRVIFRVRQGERATPGATENLPPLDVAMLA
jgi:hypothetical protein